MSSGSDVSAVVLGEADVSANLTDDLEMADSRVYSIHTGGN
jgi:hypothetical protein